MNPAVEKRLNLINNRPTLPAVVNNLKKALSESKTDAARLAAIIHDDPAMMAKILKVVNSALYGGINKITSVQQAVARMGFSTVSNIALSTSVFSSFGKKGEKDFNREEFWRHSICTGIAASVLHDRAKGALSRQYPKDLLHLSGLLHDIGKIIFEQFFHDEFVNAVNSCAERMIPLYQVELEVILSDHAQVGAWLGKKWSLSPEYIETIRWHHEPENASPEHKEIVTLCHAANYICNLEQIGNSGDSVAPAFFQSVWKKLGLGVGDITPIADQVREESKKSEILLSFL